MMEIYGLAARRNEAKELSLIVSDANMLGRFCHTKYHFPARPQERI